MSSVEDRIKERERHHRYYLANREKVLEYHRRWRKANPEKHREAKRRWRLAHPEEHRAAQRRRSARHRAKYRELLNEKNKQYWAKHRDKRLAITRKSQRKAAGIKNATGETKCGPCEICRRVTQLHYDHDRNSGLFRGWLCGNCNRGMGLAHHDPKILRLMAEYLEAHGLGASQNGNQ